jgi:SAM-dependent methyltransferase
VLPSARLGVTIILVVPMSEGEAKTQAHDPVLPPDDLRTFVVGGARDDFVPIGEKFLTYYVEECGLKPDEHMLEIGCGLGRMAMPLAGYLSPEGSYDAFDVVPEAVEWCTENISSRYPNFRFQLADIYNEIRYNPTGQIKARDYTFPYADGSFDFAIAHSVFTHMFPEDVEHYFAETARVLKKGGRFFVTFFLLNEETLAKIESGESRLLFPDDYGTHRVDRTQPGIPEGMVAHNESFVRDLCARFGLEPRPIFRGRWPGREVTFTRQDILVADRV